MPRESPPVTVDPHADASTHAPRTPLWREPAFLAVLALTAGAYLLRMDLLPAVGEEPRVATMAREMLETGDWLVPRQQGQVFAERPPMGAWLMAIVGALRGRVDEWAIRLPSALAILWTAAAIYAYGRCFLSPLGAAYAACAYATAAQVLEIGRMGESEAVFTALLSSALLLWHAGQTRGWRAVVYWPLAYALLAGAALVKGPQAPVYVLGAIVVHCALRRRWRELLSPPHLLALAVGAGLVCAWAVPFALATDRHALWTAWALLSAKRFGLDGLAAHLATYPLEVASCLLPWSVIALPLIWPSVRRRLRDRPEHVAFLITACAVSFPTVWLAHGAKARYFLPMYPCAALLLGFIAQRLYEAPRGSAARLRWDLLGWASLTLAVGAAIALTLADVLPLDRLPIEGIERLKPPTPDRILLIVACLLAAAAMHLSRRGRLAAHWGVLAMGLFMASMYQGVVMNVSHRAWHRPDAEVAALVGSVPVEHELVSFGPIDHRFCYLLDRHVSELPWPRDASDVPPGVRYFFMSRWPGDNAERKRLGRGLQWHEVRPGSLPFRWRRLGTVCTDRRLIPGKLETITVLGEVIRDPAGRPLPPKPPAAPAS